MFGRFHRHVSKLLHHLAPAQPPLARHRASAALRPPLLHPNGDRFLDSGLVVTTEFVTNAVLHGTPVGHLIYFALDVDPTRLRIEVHDARGDCLPAFSSPGLDGETGRGLHLVDSLTKRWGCCPRRPVGKIVWGEVAA
ncbi:ATP-binding protein [Kitasatospora sp. NPDC101157]|uniref:ATP-binding protein n=1 Tax=Kitasatospora sp. NPDC101157 TaxID=3364098 RepID=UPI00380DB0EE